MSDSPYQSPESFETSKPSQPASATRPTSATVFGILNLVFACLGLCGVVFGAIAMFAASSIPNAPPNPAIELMEQNEAYRMFTIVTMGLGFLATIALGLGGIGLLMMRSWGRKLSIGYAVYTIIAGLVGTVANWFWLIQPLLEQADAMGPGPEKAGAIGGAIGGMFGGCIGLAYPVILLFFMMRPSLVQAFSQNQESGF
jgi:hypothetical protein